MRAGAMRAKGPADAHAGRVLASLSHVHSGDHNGVGEQLEACRPYLLTIAQNELPVDLRAKVGASDLVQETLTRAIEHFDEFRGDHQAELAGWLRQILVNHVANVRRWFTTAKRDTKLEGPAASGRAVSCDPSPSSIVARRDEAQRLEDAVRRLPEHYQVVIRMRHQENQTFAAIAKSLGKTQGAVEKIWARAIESLQSELEL